MPNILAQLSSVFAAAVHTATGIDADPLLSVTQSETFGDYQSNVAMSLAKKLSQGGQKTAPRAVAEKIVQTLQALPPTGSILLISELSIAGPGFINVRINPAWLGEQITLICADPRLGVRTVDQPQTIVVDYSGTNVAKQMHVGHLRSTIIGDAICRVLSFAGNTVIRQNHIGDWGTQFGMLIAYLRDRPADQAAGIEDLDKFYKAARQRFDSEPAFADNARATVVRLQAGDAAERRQWQQIVEESRRHFQPIYERLGVLLTAEDERGESFYNDRLAGDVADLKSSGAAVMSEGATVVFEEGVEAPLIVEKTGGGYGYATTDLSALRYRVADLHADRVIYVVGMPQTQHLRQVFAAGRRAGWAGSARLDHASFGSVLGEDGRMLKTRSGDSVKLIDLLNEAEDRAFTLVTGKDPALAEEQRHAIARAVGIGAVKYADLSKDRTGDYVFSFDQMLAMDGNTAPYLQYAHARIQSIFRRAAERGIEVVRPMHAPVDLQSPFELLLAKHLLRFSEVIDLLCRELRPHHLCTYLYDLATRFSGFFENCPVLQSEEPARSSRLTLCEATGRTLALGLDLLGIEHPDRM